MTGSVDVVMEDPRWSVVDIAGIGTQLMAALHRDLGIPNGAEAVIMACDDARIAQLNGDFRDKLTPTNVLSWPSQNRAAVVPGDRPSPPEDLELGDIAVAFETCRREAIQHGKSLEAHVTHLVLHGLLHLLGYDHEDDADACLMEEIEVNLLETLGIPNPYGNELTV